MNILKMIIKNFEVSKFERIKKIVYKQTSKIFKKFKKKSVM